MNAQERQLIDDLFDRLSRLEGAARDPAAATAIAQELSRAPNAVYALVQTVLVQDEALKHANAHIQELEAARAPEQAPQGGFLDTMRDALFGQQGGGSVPSVRSAESSRPETSRPDTSRPVWNSGAVEQRIQQGGAGNPGAMPQQPSMGNGGGGMFGGGGGSFLGTAAASAAGMIGGSLLLNSFRGLMGGGHQSFGESGGLGGSSEARSPWSGNQSGSELARDAGINDVSSGNRADADTSRQGSYDQAQNDQDADDDADADDGDYSDDDDSGDSDYA
jgi:hypothetical protein